MVIRSDTPAASARVRASSACWTERVSVVTRAPRCAARMAASPQPVPISMTRDPSRTPAMSSTPSILRCCAVVSDSRCCPSGPTGPENQAAEYIIDSSRKTWNRSFDRS
jgi:hypothetical protein